MKMCNRRLPWPPGRSGMPKSIPGKSKRGKTMGSCFSCHANSDAKYGHVMYGVDRGIEMATTSRDYRVHCDCNCSVQDTSVFCGGCFSGRSLFWWRGRWWCLALFIFLFSTIDLLAGCLAAANTTALPAGSCANTAVEQQK